MKKALALVVFALFLEGAVLLQLAAPLLPTADAAATVMAQAPRSAARPAPPCGEGGNKC